MRSQPDRVMSATAGTDPAIWRRIPADALKTDGARHLLRAWQASRTDHLVPSSGIVNPSLLGEIAGNLCFVDVEPVSQRMRFRFVGSRLAAWLGDDLVARFVDETPFLADRRQYESDCRLAIREARPVAAMVSGVPLHDGRCVALERVILPLTHGMRAADGVVGGCFELDAAERTAPRRSSSRQVDMAGLPIGPGAPHEPVPARRG